MRVYNVNKAIGLASSGVEYAQRYRREVLAGLDGVEDLYVFTDYMPTNPSVFTDRLGFAPDQVLWIYNLLGGRGTRPCTVSVADFLATLGQPHTVASTTPAYTDVALDGSPVRYRIRTLDGGFVDRVETLSGGRAVRVEHYDDSLNNVEHLHENRVARRVFYTPDGRVAAEQLYRDGEIARTVVTAASPLHDHAVSHRGRPGAFHGDMLLDGRAQFFQLVFAHLLDRPDDVVIVDRALDVIDGIYPVLGDHRLYSVVHAEHVDATQLRDGVRLWNNHYEHVFTRPDLVDGLIVSTRRQQAALRAQLPPRDGPGGLEVVCIPAGAVSTRPAIAEYDRHALVTASRLATEKHLDALVRAVAAARTTLPALRLDIYGEGERKGLLATIRETGMEDCVRLMGHRELGGVLGSYALYVSASTSEGFGLSLLEAMSEGLPIVGFDVDYGNRELVEPGVNGILAPHVAGEPDADALAEAIVGVLGSASLDDMRRHSLRKAEAYGVAHVRRLWERLLCEEDTC